MFISLFQGVTYKVQGVKQKRRAYDSTDVNNLVFKSKLFVSWGYYTICSENFVIKFRVSCLHPVVFVTNFATTY